LQYFILSTPVAPLGHPVTGGVTQILESIGSVLLSDGHSVSVVAPEGSRLAPVLQGAELITVPGELHLSAQYDEREGPPVYSEHSVLGNMLHETKRRARSADTIINLSYDWLALHMTDRMPCRMLHYLSTALTNLGMGQIIPELARRYPQRLAVQSHAQAMLYGEELPFFLIRNGLDLTQYRFNPAPENLLAFAGRISPEKGLETALMAAERLNLPIRVMGEVVDLEYWEDCLRRYPGAQVEHTGHLPMDSFQRKLGECGVLLFTPRWMEAQGLVGLIAQACGVPVVSYEGTGPAETIVQGETGFAVPRDDEAALLQAVEASMKLDRGQCRRHMEHEYSRAVMERSIREWVSVAR
jgi:UDP-glucose:tetrahydrobiopterin glucosyltransferase